MVNEWTLLIIRLIQWNNIGTEIAMLWNCIGKALGFLLKYGMNYTCRK